VEMAWNIKELLDAWNIGTSFWLRQTVFTRVSNALANSKSRFKDDLYPLIVTFFTSALWHGTAHFFSSYYLSYYILY
jgi:D-alanyl-lipoteichoic acid acyltransferase DltB (MBOAT superfamily)